jgi:diketogulonate reductase-like aldo/keto reductase
VPKSSNPAHLKENLDLFDFTLSDEDMHALSSATSPPVTGGGDGKTSGDCGVP